MERDERDKTHGDHFPGPFKWLCYIIMAKFEFSKAVTINPF